MNKVLILLLIVQAVISVNSIRSKKLAREETQTRQSNVKYIKTNNLYASLLEQPHEFYEAEFETRIDHFRPLNQQRVNFVRIIYFNTSSISLNHKLPFRPTMSILFISKIMAPFSFTSRRHTTTQHNGLKMDP